MYNPPPFRVADPVVLRDAIRRFGAGDLITVGADGPQATFLPWLVDDGVTRLTGHLARANPQWRDADPATPVLVRFRGSHGYVSPGWYPSKREHGKVVPTWNYELVDVRGTLVVHDDPAWVERLVSDLTDHHEAPFAVPWRTTHAPADFVATLTRTIVGVEVRITSIEGKRKLSQNRPDADRDGVLAGLEAPGATAAQAALAAAMRAALDR